MHYKKKYTKPNIVPVELDMQVCAVVMSKEHTHPTLPPGDGLIGSNENENTIIVNDRIFEDQLNSQHSPF